MMVLESVALIVISYLFGSIPFGLIIGKFNGVDIRKVGSGNIGATNVTRTVGPKAGKLCFFCDFLKGFVPVLGAVLTPGLTTLVVLSCAAAATLGHIYPCWLKFKGGKGVSVAAGALLAIVPYAVAIAFAVWVIVFFATRYVSVGSMAAAVTFVVAVWALRYLGVPQSNDASSIWTAWFCTAVGALAIVMHRSNIRRLIDGTENRFEKKK
ncbi:MAG: glycerol-3-phosphate 1-O-acyltransferase PlsY [Victivallaceae bacterium]|nr:glycerol-3-phosphate 1-O-acyltransferase PlsY [Victivallaceae bacterium]